MSVVGGAPHPGDPDGGSHSSLWNRGAGYWPKSAGPAIDRISLTFNDLPIQPSLPPAGGQGPGGPGPLTPERGALLASRPMVPSVSKVAKPREDLRRILGAWDAAALIVGITIGSGIFATPPLVAGYLPGSAAILGIWTLGGLAAFCGALCFAELAGMFPWTGGSYAFLRESYGRLPAFAYGWSALLVTYPASIAAVSVVFTAYLARVVPIGEGARPWVAASLCLALAGLNIVGVRLGAWVLRLMTATKVAALAAVAVAAVVAGQSRTANLAPISLDPTLGVGLGAIALAFTSVVWTFEGWSDGPTIAGETRRPDRDVPRALLLGTLGVTAIYLLVNLAYLLVLGVEGVRTTDSVAVSTALRVFGRGGAGFVTGLVLVSTLGSMLGMIIAASRVFFAMGRDRLFFDWVGQVHPRFHTPAVAVTGVGLVSALYAAFGTFEAIIRYFVFVAGIFLLLNVGSILLHRRRRPGASRPVRVPLYPLPVLVYLVVEAGLLIQLLRENPRNSLAGLLLVLASVPVFFLWERSRNRNEGGTRK